MQQYQSEGGRCEYGGWRKGTKKEEPGSIRHFEKVKKELQDAYNTLVDPEDKDEDTVGAKILRADRAVLKVLRDEYKREELEKARAKRGKRKRDNEEDEEEESDLDDGLDYD